MKFKRLVTILTLGLVFNFFTVFYSNSFEALQCPVGKPYAAWDFNAGDSPLKSTDYVEWVNDHGGVVPIAGTELQGIEFNYKGKATSKDSSSEWRYQIKTPLNRTWEYFRILQPENFHHRYAVRIKAPSNLDEALWEKGNHVVSSKGKEGTIGEVDNKYLYLENITVRFDRNWGKGITITNKVSGASFVSTDSSHVANNNKLSAQWQGRYSNAGMVVEYKSILPSKNGESGTGYFSPKLSASESHKASGSISNQISNMPGVAFDLRDNGKIIEYVIERTRSSAEGVRDGIYRVWKRTETSNWNLIHENTNLYVWQPNNFFDHGYIFGWANSGFEEETKFYLLGWQLWAEKPVYLP